MRLSIARVSLLMCGFGCGALEERDVALAVPADSRAEVWVLILRTDAGALVAGSPSLVSDGLPARIEVRSEEPLRLELWGYSGLDAQRLRACGVTAKEGKGPIPPPGELFVATGLPENHTLERASSTTNLILSYDRCAVDPEDCLGVEAITTGLPTDHDSRMLVSLGDGRYLLAGRITPATLGLSVVDGAGRPEVQHTITTTTSPTGLVLDRADRVYVAAADGTIQLLRRADLSLVSAGALRDMAYLEGPGEDGLVIAGRFSGPTTRFAAGSTQAIDAPDLLPMLHGFGAKASGGTYAARADGLYARRPDGGWDQELRTAVAGRVRFSFDDARVVAVNKDAVWLKSEERWTPYPRPGDDLPFQSAGFLGDDAILVGGTEGQLRLLDLRFDEWCRVRADTDQTINAIVPDGAGGLLLGTHGQHWIRVHR